MADEPLHRSYFARTATLAIFLAGGLAILIIALVLNVEELDRIVILAFPLGFWLLAQGVMILAAIGAFWFAARQEGLDRKHGVSEGV